MNLHETRATILHPLFNWMFTPILNVTLVISGISWLLGLILNFFKNPVIDYLGACALLVALCTTGTFILFLIISLIFKRAGKIVFKGTSISIHNGHWTKSYRLSTEVYFEINVKNLANKDKAVADLKEILPYGNFLILKENVNRKYEIELTPAILNFVAVATVHPYSSRSMFRYKTTDLLKEFAGMIWGAS